MEQGDRKAMKKAQKEQAEKIIRLLEQVHSGIKKAVERGQSETAMELLSQCQESAIELGESIEEVEGEGFVTVSLLENYCEAVYQAYTQISQVKGVNALKVQKNLGKALVCVSNSIKNDIKIRKEVVFLPYKACMWDSLESVWKAAEEDEDCDVYVIPIPYYDKNPDGSFREMHYEGEQYPDYVPVTWYEDYDFGEHQPDVIFIHNPYDECNYVTSVHPFFYSKNIKRFTEKLVYIPYFILEEPEPEDEEAVKNIAHFCTLPGVIYADRVVVQSEKMRQIYIKVMMDFTTDHVTSENGLKEDGRLDNTKIRAKAVVNQEYWKNKILGIGSPKVDKLLGTKKENLEIPTEWIRVIQKEDGSWKKIIFYNTSVTALLEYGKKMLDKIQEVFQVFEENQDEVALLWRPHPLIKATIESMRPELWKDYEVIVKNYKNAEWGIYDDTADVDRAMALCDGYYGDPSSLESLYKKAGKITFLQNVSIRNHLFFHDAVNVKNEIWFSAINTNGLYKMNEITKKIQFVCFFPDANIEGIFLHSKVFHYKDKLIFVPFQAKSISIFDLKTKEMVSIKIPDDLSYTDYSLFYTAIQDKNIIYMIPCRCEQMIKFNVQNNEIELIDVILNDKNHKWNREFPFVVKGAYKRNNFIYFGSYISNFIEKFDLESGQVVYYDISTDIGGISHMVCVDHVFWLIGNNGKVSQWNEEQGLINTISIEKEYTKGQAFFDVFLYENIIFLTGGMSQKIYMLNIYTGDVVSVCIGNKIPEKELKIFWGSYTSLFMLDDKTLAVLCAKDGVIYKIDPFGVVDTICNTEYQVENIILNRIIHYQEIKENEIKENENFSGSTIYHELI